MRKIEKEMLQAIQSRQNWEKDNTRVSIFVNPITKRVDSVWVRLYGNVIYRRDAGRRPWFSSCGWNSATTRSRLQALGCNCRIKDRVLVDCDTLRPIPSRRLEAIKGAL